MYMTLNDLGHDLQRPLIDLLEKKNPLKIDDELLSSEIQKDSTLSS